MHGPAKHHQVKVGIRLRMLRHGGQHLAKSFQMVKVNGPLASALLPFLCQKLGKLRGGNGWPGRRRGRVGFDSGKLCQACRRLSARQAATSSARVWRRAVTSESVQSQCCRWAKSGGRSATAHGRVLDPQPRPLSKVRTIRRLARASSLSS